MERLLSTRLKRRKLLLGAGALTGLAIASQWPQRVVATPKFIDYPFSLGVASGFPSSNSVVLWTRLAPDPLNGGGMIPTDVPIQWTLATDPNLRNVVRQGTATARPELAHSVRVLVQGLQPAQTYWYQFRVADIVSPIGRTRTAPPPGVMSDRFRFAFASCQHYEQGFFTAYKYMAAEDLDLVVHLGDYIYEGQPSTSPNVVRRHEGTGEPITLEQYRNRHAQYKTDLDLQAAHAAFPWAVTWDDHEVDNNWADEIPQDPQLQSREQFLARRAAAFQAYYEHMPLRPESTPSGINLLLYQNLRFGRLVEFNILDTRQYRTDQPCGDGIKPQCAEAFDPNATMTGTTQERWLLKNLSRSQARWNVIAQQVVFLQYDWTAGSDSAFNVDAWDGYVAARQRILNFLNKRRPANPFVLTGDTHSSWVSDLLANFSQPNSPVVGTEFVGTSITTNFGASDRIEAARPESPWVKYFNGRQRGYVVCDLTPDRWRIEFRLLPSSPTPIPTVPSRDLPITTAAAFELPNGGTVQPA